MAAYPHLSQHSHQHYQGMGLTAKQETTFFYDLLCRLVTSPVFVRCQHLIARKIAELFGFNHGIQPFYEACCFDGLSRGSVLCLLNASFGKAISQRHNSILYAKIDDHGVRWGDTGRILAQWRHPIASRVALVLPYWAMHSASYRLIGMAIELARKVGTFFSVVDFLSCINIDKRPSYGRLNINPSYTNVLYDILIYFVYYGGLLMAMYAILATIANGGRAISEKTERPVELN